MEKHAMRNGAIAVLLGTTLAACGGDADPRSGQVSGPIVDGTLDSGDPATVYIDVGCSGTLVTSRVVLTACHCLEGVGGQVEVFFGSNINGSGTWITSIDHAVYPGGCTGDGDLAMITLSEPGPTTPIPINDRNLGMYIGQPVRVVGFGVTGEYEGGSGVKRKGDTVLGDVDTGIMLCDPQIESGTCYGDSGGPNFMTFDGKEYVVGTTSYGTTACGSGWDVSARTDSHYDWLEQYILAHDPADCGADGQCAAGCPAPDPDCPCAGDGHCTAACADPTSDPDCDDGCGADGVCSADCATLDSDCCVADGDCFDACGAADPDCGGSGEGGASSGPSGSGAGPGATPDDDDDGDAEEDGAGGLVGNVACAARPGQSGSLGVGLFFAAVALARVRAGSRRRPSAR
jgi:hypothetical protein